MAQSALRNCDICMSAPGTEYCLNCEQYFCNSCKSFHKRAKVSKNHEFESGSNVIPEVKPKCTEHNDDFIFLCTSCDVSVCKKCVSGKHTGHSMADIDDSISKLREKAKNEIHFKRNLVTTNLEKMEQGLNKFKSDVTSVIKTIKEDGNRIKDMVDKEVEKMIMAVKDKANKPKEKFSNVISNTRRLVEETNALEKRRENLQQNREDAGLISKLKTLNDEMSTLQIMPLPVFPSMKFSSKSITNNDVINLLGTFNLCETQTTKVQTSETTRSETQTTKVQTSETTRSVVTQEKTKQRGYLYRCRSCGDEQIQPNNMMGFVCLSEQVCSFVPPG